MMNLRTVRKWGVLIGAAWVLACSGGGEGAVDVAGTVETRGVDRSLTDLQDDSQVLDSKEGVGEADAVTDSGFEAHDDGAQDEDYGDGDDYGDDYGNGDEKGDSAGDTAGDADGDGVADEEDNCPGIANEDQGNIDGDALGDLCDWDIDGDNLVNAEDNCPEMSNGGQEDMDNDGVGDACDDDPDGDGLLLPDDNCPNAYNPGQDDFENDGIGDVCDEDDDNDGVPDLYDEAPNDDEWPGLAIAGIIYAHTSSTLYSWSTETMDLQQVGAIGWPDGYGSESMTDIAIDYDGVLYGISFNHLFRCSAINAKCIHLASLPSSFNGLTIVPAGTVEPGKEVLIGISNAGGWNRIDVDGNQATITPLGSYGAGYSSSGDAYSITNIGTFAAVNVTGVSSDVLARVDPVDGTVLEEMGPLSPYANIWGLAGDSAAAYAFDSSGAILQLDIGTGATQVVLEPAQGASWWGAGVTTRYVGG